METIKLAQIFKKNYEDYYCSKELLQNAYGTSLERDAIGLSIKTHGQLEPIVLWKKRGMVNVIDGRNRIDACMALGIEKLNCVYLPTNSTKKELQMYIDKTRVRVNTNKEQKAIEAYNRTILPKDHIDKLTQAEASRVLGVQVIDIKHCSAINKIAPSILPELFKNADYQMVKSNGKSTRALSSIRKELETRDARDKQGVADPTGGDKAFAKGHTTLQLAIDTMKDNGLTMAGVGMLLRQEGQKLIGEHIVEKTDEGKEPAVIMDSLFKFGETANKEVLKGTSPRVVMAAHEFSANSNKIKEGIEERKAEILAKRTI